jgi:hypothetical protein
MYFFGATSVIEWEEKKHFILGLQWIYARTKPSCHNEWQDEQVLEPPF